MNSVQKELSVVRNFDYMGSVEKGVLTKDQTKRLQFLAGELVQCRKRAVRELVMIGEHLFTARSILTADRSFRDWVEREANIPVRTAYRHIEAFNRFRQCNHLEFIDDDALSLLSKKEVPKSVVAKAISLANKGIPVNARKASLLANGESSTSGSGHSAGAVTTNAAKGHSGQKSGQETDDDSAAESEEPEEEEEVTIEDEMQIWNSQLSEWRKALRAACNAIPESPWVTDDVVKSVKSHVSAAASTAFLTKAHAVCPKCEGEGCKYCHKSGWMPKMEYEQFAE